MNGKYDDIIHLPHPTSARHPRMSMTDRAAQFSPFAALTGHGAAIAETSRVTQERIELSEDEKTLLDNKLQILRKLIDEHPMITATWFSPDKKKAGGSYVTATGILKKFSDTERTLILEDGTSIPLMDVTGLDCELLYSWLGDLN
ncbi:MAG: hypothetical protein SOX80_04170 [Candidatus Fimivivens sp.]|nr:hypothetical protein [Candidatus Fimivivens sp.]